MNPARCTLENIVLDELSPTSQVISWLYNSWNLKERQIPPQSKTICTHSTLDIRSSYNLRFDTNVRECDFDRARERNEMNSCKEGAGTADVGYEQCFSQLSLSLPFKSFPSALKMPVSCLCCLSPLLTQHSWNYVTRRAPSTCLQ